MTYLLVLALLLVTFVIVATQVKIDEYEITPGEAQPLAPLVTVPSHLDHKVKGTIFLTDVYLTQLTVWGWITAQFTSDAEFLPKSALVSPSSQTSQLIEQGYITMAQAKQSAKAAALTRLGYTFTPTPAGVMVYGIAAHSPATGPLQVGETLTGVNGRTTATFCALAQALDTVTPGQTVHLSVEKSTVTTAAVVKSGPTVTVPVPLAKWPADEPERTTTAPTCPGSANPARGYLGIQPTTVPWVTYTFPVLISINSAPKTGSIGGPSAGLAMTLTILDKLSSGNLTGGKKVAVTGTIAPDGTVGRVGGVADKTVAVEKAGASAFIVPYTTLPTARSKDIPSLHVYGVRNLSQALAVLKRLGGTIPPTPGS